MLCIRSIYRSPLRSTRPLSLALSYGRTYAVVSRAPLRLSEAIAKDHRELENYYQEVMQNPGRHDHQQRFGNQFTWELARHAIGEELVVYPAFEKYLGVEGRLMAEEDRREHHQVGPADSISRVRR